MSIVYVEYEFDIYCIVVVEKIKKNKVDYVMVVGIEYFIEVLNIDIKYVFVFWSKILGIKKFFCFYILEVFCMIIECDQYCEVLVVVCDKVFKDFLEVIFVDY